MNHIGMLPIKFPCEAIDFGGGVGVVVNYCRRPPDMVLNAAAVISEECQSTQELTNAFSLSAAGPVVEECRTASGATLSAAPCAQFGQKHGRITIDLQKGSRTIASCINELVNDSLITIALLNGSSTATTMQAQPGASLWYAAPATYDPSQDSGQTTERTVYQPGGFSLTALFLGMSALVLMLVCLTGWTAWTVRHQLQPAGILLLWAGFFSVLGFICGAWLGSRHRRRFSARAQTAHLEIGVVAKSMPELQRAAIAVIRSLADWVGAGRAKVAHRVQAFVQALNDRLRFAAIDRWFCLASSASGPGSLSGILARARSLTRFSGAGAVWV